MRVSVEVASPCIEVCTLDPSGQVCTGCYRTVDEIALWGQFDGADRARVVAALPGRRRLAERAAATTLARCAQCGAEFGCGANDPHNACWCTRFPPVAPRAGQSCLCPRCLAAAAA